MDDLNKKVAVKIFNLIGNVPWMELNEEAQALWLKFAGDVIEIIQKENKTNEFV